jgi:hypothetical protein
VIHATHALRGRSRARPPFALADAPGAAMTHHLGPRKKVVADLADDLRTSIAAAWTADKCSITEALEAIYIVMRDLATSVRLHRQFRLLRWVAHLHELTMLAFKAALRPTEDETCPTCPKDARQRRKGARSRRGAAP